MRLEESDLDLGMREDFFLGRLLQVGWLNRIGYCVREDIRRLPEGAVRNCQLQFLVLP